MSSNLQVKNSIKLNFFKDLNPLKGFAVRLRRPANDASDMAQTFLPLVQGVAGAIPIAGPPMQAAISGLLSILQVIDRRSQNKADLDRLALRLHRLSSHLCNAPTAQDPLEQYRRDSIIGILQETSTQLTRLQKRRPEYASVTQSIATCSSEIDRYLLDSLVQWSFQMQQSQTTQGPAITQLTAAVKLGCVTLVDATGHEHAISLTFCTSFQQLNGTLQALFTCDSIEAQLQRRYMEQEQYDLCIDDDKQVTRLTNHEWPNIEAGMTIVMRVVFEQKRHYSIEYKCYLCGAVNHINSEYSLQRQSGRSIDCRVCKRRFQVSRESSSAKRSTQSSDIDSVSRTAEMHLIRNFYIQQTVSRRLVRVLVLLNRLLMVPWLCPALRLLCVLVFLSCSLDADGAVAVSRSQSSIPFFRRSRHDNEKPRNFNAGNASPTRYSHRNGFLGDGPSTFPKTSHISPSYDAEYGYNRFEEIEADDGEDHEEWEDCEDGEDLEETN